MVLDIVRIAARSVSASLLARLAMKLDPDAAADVVLDPLRTAIEDLRQVAGYDGPVVTREAREMIAPRMHVVVPEPEEEPLAGSLAARGRR